MSNPVNPKPTPSKRSGRLHEKFTIANRMEPYANRLRLRLGHFDVSNPKKKQELMAARSEMIKILVKKKIRQNEAQWAVTQTLDIAADHQLEVLRREHNLDDLRRSQMHLRRLSKQLDQFSRAIARLPPLTKGKLNKIVAELDWRNFDTETFNELIQAMTDALSTSSPACTGERILTAMNEKIRSGTHPAVVQIVRTARPALVELWESIPAETRTQMEANLRNWRPPKRRPAIKFVNRLVALLEKFRPQLKRGRRPPIVRRLGQRVARIWHDLGLNVGRAFSGHRKYQGAFQRFIRFALVAVGEDARLSNRQVTNLKSHKPHKCDSRAKLLK